MIFFTADTHLGHPNIIRFCKRPFLKDGDLDEKGNWISQEIAKARCKEMDKCIIDNWNSVVTEKDTVYHLGDVMTWKESDLGTMFFTAYSNYRKQLNGKIFLIPGNHDHKIHACFPHRLLGKAPLYELKYNKEHITMCHYAMRVWPRSHFNSWHLYGHSHSLLPPKGKSFDVGVDNNYFKPLSFDQVKAIMNALPDNDNWIRRLPGYEDKDEKKNS